MSTPTASGVTQITGFSPQFLVGDLPVAIEYYRNKRGFTPDFVHESFYASVSWDGFEGC
jgi:hypothetical protein